jgi:LPXTG-motif cell wall-anchored protein
LVFGTIGLTEFLGRLSWKYFKGSVGFPFTLTIIGILLILLGMFFQKNKKKIDAYIKNSFPEFILKLRPQKDL